MPRYPDLKHIIRTGSIIALFLILIIYGLWQGRDILFGLNLTVSGIADGQTFDSPVASFSGKSKHAREVMVNGRAVNLSTDGTWNDTIILPDGYSIITVTASDKFGKMNTKEFRVYYNAPPKETPTPPEPRPLTPPTTKETPPEIINTTNEETPVTTPSVENTNN